MTTVKQEDLAQSVADALQYISYYHPRDYIAHLARAFDREQSPAAKDAIAQILTNSRMCAEGHRPICQDTGIVNVFLKIGMDVKLEGFTGSVANAVNEGVRRAYLHPDNKLRASILEDPQFARKNTRDNTPAVVSMELVPGKTVEVDVAAKGRGGLSTVLDIKIRSFPTHAANKPIAMIPNCAATRHVHFVLDGSGPAEFEAPSLEDWPKVTWAPSAQSRRVELDSLTPEEVMRWKPGETLLLSGKILTGRDAAHKRIEDMLAKGEKLPVDFTNRVIYYVGPVDPVRDEVVGPAGPTTATRMDKFVETMLAKTGLVAMIGKGERGPVAVEAIRKHKAASLIAVGGAAFLVAKAIRNSRVVGFDDLGMEAIYEFEVKDMPVTVAVDAKGESVHRSGPAEWEKRIRELKIPVTVA